MTKLSCKLRFALPFFVFIAVLLFLWKGLDRNPHALSSPLINKPVPAFNLPALMNPRHLLTNRIFIGHVSLLNVFATWCSSCHVEHAVLMDIARSHRVSLIGLNYKDGRLVAERWLKKNGNPYRKIIYDPRGGLGIDLGVYGTPETFLIDRQGVIRYKYTGPVSQDVWRELLLPKIKGLT